MKKLLLADDHQILIDGLVKLIAEIDGVEIVGKVGDGQAVIDFLKKQSVDIVCLDIEMPKMDGIEVAQYVKAHYPDIKVLILSMYNRPQLVKELVKLQVDGYVKKDAGKLDFQLAIQKLAAGDTYYSQHFTKAWMELEKNKDETIHVTPREMQVLKLLQQGLNTNEMAEKLFVSHHTVQAHRKNLLTKFEVNGTVKLIESAIKKGFLDL